MSAPAESYIRPPENATQLETELGSDRRADIDVKQARIAGLLIDVGCEGLLLLEPENFAWLTSGGVARSTLDPRDLPGLYFSPDQRWVLAANVDSQRLFDEELDGLGFQLKEWPWHWGRQQLLADLCKGRRLASDQAFGDCQVVGETLARMRRAMTSYERACYRALGLIVAHALEATCRTMVAKVTEREIAGQISHRLLHRGAAPLVIGVAADGRSRLYRQPSFTETVIHQYAVLTVTARKYGLCVTASRSLSFGAPDESFGKELDAACKISATYVASTWPDALPKQVLSAGRRVYQIAGFEHEWRHCPQGHVTGRLPVELALTPQTEALFQEGWAITWRSSVGAAYSCDTFLVDEKGPELLTTPEAWPLRRIKVQGAEFVRPYLLQR